jgi:hypothetical protein
MEQQPPYYPPPPAGPAPSYSPGASPYGKSFTLGAALGKGFAILFGRFPVFVVMTAIALSPTIAYALLRKPDWSSLDGLYLEVFLVTVGSWLEYAFLSAAVTYAVVEQMSGRRASIGASLSVGLARMFPLFLFIIVLSLIFVAVMIPPGIISAAVGSESAIGQLVVWAAMLWFLCAFYVAVGTATVERLGMGAINRAWNLTKGARWRIFGLLVVLFVAFFAGLIVIGVVIGATERQHTYGEVNWPVLITIIIFMLLVFVGQAVFSAVTYAQLRHDKDGVEANDLAKVFE